jgi:NAD(P)-dependent dehydrogenase (short-subunit alcohol dehydrogenase family)
MDTTQYLNGLFSLQGKTAIVTGGTGVLGGMMARGLAQAGAKVAILGRRREIAETMAGEIAAQGGEAMAAPADVMEKAELEAAREAVLAKWGKLDILVNCAGGTTKEATIPVDKTYFDMGFEAMKYVIDLNLIGTMLPSQVFGEAMAQQRQGCVINISSMNAQRGMTRSVAYGAAKTAIDNFTRFLSIEFATKFGEGMRVNAIVPGFFLGEQNRAMLVNPDNSLTPRGQTIINHTPMGKFGEPEDLIGALIWLCSPSAKFVTGTLVVVDGGVNAWNGI